jgi:tetratricopeptide (TPR) repeat protein
MSRTGWQQDAARFLLCVLLVAITGSARADDDAGNRSVFAYGAGNRALALGGAYAAVGGDPSTVIWNPAGLGQLERRQFQLTHTNLIGLGFNEQYASFVYPDWRWGVGSVTLRHFGVNGVEERNERNILVGDDLSNNETEVALGYGRRLGANWSVGGAVKLQRQSLAGFSDSGLGVDIGVQVKPFLVAGSSLAWAQDLTAGLAIRNAIEPSIRLDDEPVPDPTALRFGLAYNRPAWREGSVLAALDFEKTQDMDVRIHAGLEVRINPILALRGGLNNGTLAAGTGLKWRDVTLDYVFEDNVLNSVHRFGVSFAFGPTTTQSRQLSFAAEQAELERNLAAAFDARLKNRVDRLLQKARAAVGENKAAEALEIFAMLKVLAPDLQEVTQLEAQVHREEGLSLEKAGDLAGATLALGRAVSLAPGDSLARFSLARVRAESDRHAARSAEIRRLLNQAMDSLATDQLLNARDGFYRVLELSPEDPEALTMLRQTEIAIAHRAENLGQQAKILVQAGRFEEAEKNLKKARKLNSKSADLDQIMALLEQGRRRAEVAAKGAEDRRAETGPGTPPPSATPETEGAISRAKGNQEPLLETRRKEIAELYRRGMTAVQEGRVDDAVRFWEIVWSADPGHNGVQESLKREYLIRGIEAFATGQLESAVRDWERALQLDPEDERVRGYLDRAHRQQTEIRRIAEETR